MDSNARIDLHVVRTIPEIINVSFDFVRQNFRLFRNSILLLAFPPALLGMIGFVYYFLSVLTGLESSYSDDPYSTNYDSFLSDLSSNTPALLFGSILYGVASTLLIAVVHVIIDLYRKHTPEEFAQITVRDVWEGVQEIFLMLLGTNFLLGISFVIVWVLAIFIPFGQIGIYVLITFGVLYYPLRIYERRGIFQSIIVSSKLVQGRWWATFGMLWLQSLLQLTLTGLFALPIYISSILSAMGVIDFDEVMADKGVLFYALTFLGLLFMTLLFTLAIIPILNFIFHYFSLTEKKHSPTLAAEIESIGME